MLRIPLIILATGAFVLGADPHDEFRVKREAVFEFASPPVVTRAGDQVSIAFTTTAFCDVTVAIEDARGRIVRHLASGVLGPNAPAPFRKDSKIQRIVWDGKDDAGRYIDDKDALTVRVSLGLKPRFERTLFWSPHKRIGGPSPIPRPAPEGVYVLETYALDHGTYGGAQLRLFTHDGDYVRTVYPFPAAQLEKIPGLPMRRFPLLGKVLPMKSNYYQSSLLTTGLEAWGGPGDTPHGIAVAGGRIALAYHRLNRLATDPTRSAGPPLVGPETAFTAFSHVHRKEISFGPRSAAFSPDGKTLYLTGFVYRWRNWYCDWVHAVMKLDFAAGKPWELFVGSTKLNDHGSDAAHFKVPTSVACDAKGRVYVSDYINDRIQVFTPDGKLFKTIPIKRPAHVEVHQKTGEIYVFSWFFVTRLTTTDGEGPTFTRLGPVENPRVITHCKLPLTDHRTQIAWNNSGGLQYRVALDSWTDPPTIWLVPGRAKWRSSGNSAIVGQNWNNSLRLLVEKDGDLELKRDFTADASKKALRTIPPINWRQRLVVNPRNGRLYVNEGDSGVAKSVNQLIEIKPDTGRITTLDLPLGAEDFCFDQTGLAYVRTDKVIARYDSRSWQEIPFDYGEQFTGHSWGMGARAANLISAIHTPGHRSNPFWHQGGIDVSVKGHVVVTTCNLFEPPDRRTEAQKRTFEFAGKPYTPKIYPGRMRWGEIHVYDRRGKLLIEDAVPGMGHLNGIGIDAEDNLYMLSASKRLIDGKLHDPTRPRDATGTLVKVKAGRVKVLAAGKGKRIAMPLGEAGRPEGPPQIKGWPTGWIDGAQWFYGGVGFCTPGRCICANSRFDLDYFNRSFAPEPLSYTVAVLDSAGNLILRVGRYGNVEDGLPLVNAGGPKRPNRVGGDEVALMHACYVATDTDRRLFIADQGNARIVSVKLDYHRTRRIALKDVSAGP